MKWMCMSVHESLIRERWNSAKLMRKLVFPLDES